MCPTCNPAEKRYEPLDIYKVYERINKVHPKELQLSTQDVGYVRGELLDIQDSMCPLCNRLIRRATLDHHHTLVNKGNGKCRLVICAGCNSLVGRIENALPRYLVDYSDAPTWLRNLANYFEAGTTNLIHPTERPRVKLTKTEFKGFQEFMKQRFNKGIKYPAKGLLTLSQESYYTLYVNKTNIANMTSKGTDDKNIK